MQIITKDSGVNTVINVLDEEDIINYKTYIDLLIQNEIFVYEDQFKSFARYAEVVGESLMLYVQPVVEEIAGYELFPAYSYTRRYVKGAVMPRHKDRHSCEISCTITLDYNTSEPWPIYVELEGKEIEIPLEPGQMMWYRGCETPHWRNTFHGEYSTHCFLHFVKKDGDNSKFKYDQRSSIAANSDFKETLKRRLQSIKQVYNIDFGSQISSDFTHNFHAELKEKFIAFCFEGRKGKDIVIPFFLEELMKEMLDKKGTFSLASFKDHPHSPVALRFAKELILKGYWDIVE